MSPIESIVHDILPVPEQLDSVDVDRFEAPVPMKLLMIGGINDCNEEFAGAENEVAEDAGGIVKVTGLGARCTVVVFVAPTIVLVSIGRVDVEEVEVEAEAKAEAEHASFILTVTVVKIVVVLLVVSFWEQPPAQRLSTERESPAASPCSWPETRGPEKAKRTVMSDNFILEVN